jgi:hypothetical protein
VSPVRYALGFYIPEDGILHSYRRVNLKFCTDTNYTTYESFHWEGFKNGKVSYMISRAKRS